ncbi:MAG: hypothetical protein HW374_1087 [Bacteroidetes bacterium]|nr:hypothetical protein [Bacteroidota bacterium]
MRFPHIVLAMSVLCLRFSLAESQTLTKAFVDDNSKFTNIGNIGITISNYGVFGHGFRLWPQQPSMQYPRGSGIEHCFVGGLWVGALTPNGIRVTTGAVDVPSLRSVGEGFEFTTDTQRVDPEIARNSLDKIRVVPNPYVAASTWEERNPFSSGRGPRAIHFTHLPQVCTIRIFTISGEVVAEIKHNGEMLDGTAEWNLLTRDNLSVAYGIYIYHVDAGSVGEKVGKFAIIK